MKTTLRKIARLSFLLIVPTIFMASCQEDTVDPQAGMPGKVVPPPKKS